MWESRRQTADWERFCQGRNLLEGSLRGLHDELIPGWVCSGQTSAQAQDFSDRVQAFAYGATPSYLIDAILDLLAPAPGELFVDLGCGAGNVCAAALQRGARALGLEANPELARAAREFMRAAPAERWEFREADFLDSDWSQANLAYATTARFPDSVLQAIAQRAEKASALRALVTLGRPLPLSWPKRELGERLVCWNEGQNHRWERLYLYLNASTAVKE